jgi:hypothetical protein
MSLCFGSQVWAGPCSLVPIPGQGTAARQNLALGTINLSMGRLNLDVRRTNLRRMEQPPRLNYHFGQR